MESSPHGAAVRISPIILLLIYAASPLAAQSAKNAPESPVMQRAEYRQAVQALKDRLPEVAVARLKKLLAASAPLILDQVPPPRERGGRIETSEALG